MDETRNELLWIGLTEDKVKETIKNESLTKLLIEMICTLRKFSPDKQTLDRNVGKLIYQAATTSKAQMRQHLPLLIEYIAKQSIDSEMKLTAAIEYLLANTTSVNREQFEQSAGVGVTITAEQITKAVQEQIEKNRDELIAKRYRFNVGIIIVEARKTLKFADGKLVKAEVDSQILQLLGPKTEADSAKPKKDTKEPKDTSTKTKEPKEEDCRDMMELLRRVNLHSVGDNYKTDGYVITSNTMKLLSEHVRETGGKVRTRFPPEPNGILHIGHAKAININFGYAQAHDGFCVLRYDDTNPEKEEERFVVGIRDMVEWLGYKPYKITYSSDYFDELYQLAVKLIKNGLAYVCHQKPEELKGFNPPPSPWRNRSIQENLQLFEAMKSGKLFEGEATLRMKLTLEEGKVDPVAYRIKMAPHHRTGSQWCIYPTYDFTHCLVDSLENISHSLCTKEFQSRRSAYYWLCNSLDVYCPVQWEYSRLNVNYTVVSKRKIAKLIDEKIVDDWDDPRLFTLTALRRRGFPPQAINQFCAQMGLTVASAIVDPIMLEASVRDVLNVTAPRAMAVLSPIRILIKNKAHQLVPTYIEIPDFPSDPASPKHMVPFEKEIYIESDDFRDDTSDPSYRRLTPKQMVGLRHAGCAIELVTIHRKTNGEIDYLEVISHPIESLKEKPKAFIHWVSIPLNVEIRLYERLFNHKNPEDTNEVPGGFISDCNRNSKTVIKALVDVSVKYAQPYQQFQFERVGFFSVDTDSRIGNLVFNRTVGLKDSQSKN
ncbi:hypothetical protein RDWZM_002683 [Blomia tropicalis]|uniref:Probable glutamine--tRNA ligase n=1 Tax=Blomia tropicalis TaxID=40697 RepID=A0A9Q0RQ49_BLOTA|nr:hypothetical protein BLOT_001460 [Blomia tropicalis]KAJ6224138.1 hypothetical protein RDWZM_002683 [Blomia tropicalis]